MARTARAEIAGRTLSLVMTPRPMGGRGKTPSHGVHNLRGKPAPALQRTKLLCRLSLALSQQACITANGRNLGKVRVYTDMVDKAGNTEVPTECVDDRNR